jgi:SAM-dependent methyltransferase
VTGPPAARYDTVADFYATGWPDSYDDSVSEALLAAVGPVDGLRALDVACGHGRMTRELARRGADVVGVDISAALIAKARAAEQERPLGIRYVHEDIASPEHSPLTDFDVVVCSFGLNDIDDLDAALDTISGALRPGGRFVASLLHPCFPGAGDVSGAWPPTRRYYDEGWWLAGGALSSLRRQVGTNHRMLSTYVNALLRHDLRIDHLAEPPPPQQWSGPRAEAARYPVFLAVRCAKG